MRKFKFVGTEKERQDYSEYEHKRPIYSRVYDQDHIFSTITTLSWFEGSMYRHEWEEVFDTLEDKITELKELAKSQGMDCQVVLKDIPKKIEVEPTMIGIANSIIKVSITDRQSLLNFIAKQLETYLNENK